jgi:hypothetical protein
MTVPGMLDQRIRWYAPNGTTLNGFARPSYAFVRETWGRIDVDNAQQTIQPSPQSSSDVRGNASCTVNQYITVPQNGVCVCDGVLYWVRGDWVVRDQGVRRVGLERITPEQYESVPIVENLGTLEGVQLIDGEAVIDTNDPAPIADPGSVIELTASLIISNVNNGTTFLVDATAGAVTVTLPPAILSLAFRYQFKKVDASAHVVTIAAAGSDLIDGFATFLLTDANDAVSLQSDGTGWVIL